jgi:DNA-binding MarR family transcriptional regulator
MIPDLVQTIYAARFNSLIERERNGDGKPQPRPEPLAVEKLAVLMHIKANPGTTAADMAAHFNIPQASLRHATRELAKRGMIRKQRIYSPHNATRYWVTK